MTERAGVTVDGCIDELRLLVADAAQAASCPSVAWGVVQAGVLVHADGYGVLDDGRVPDANSVYRIASMTKSFTAATILALRDDGLLRLDDPVARHAPELRDLVGPTTDAAQLCIRHLLTMAGGLANDDPWADRHMDLTDAQLDATLAAGVLFAVAPGAAFEYSNLGYALLGRIAQRVGGQRLQDLVSTRLLRPLGLTDSGWSAPESPRWARPHREQDGVAIPEGTPIVADGALAPMGGLWSTVADLARWVAWLADAWPPRDSFDAGPLRRASRREMQEMHRWAGMRKAAGRVAATGYGYGLMVRQDELLGRVLTHSGGLPGYGSNMRWLPERGLGVIALGNVTYAPMAELTLAMLDVLHTHAVQPAPVSGDATLEHLGQRLIMLLDNWRDADADVLFTDNVAADESYERRQLAAARLKDRCGGRLLIEHIKCHSAASATVCVAAGPGVQRVRFQIGPIAPARVQVYELLDD